MMELGVNIDHVATVRQARRTFEPEPVRAAIICEFAGAHGIVAHLREDRRHMQDRDLELIKEVINIKLNLEMAGIPEMVEKALSLMPYQVTLVPEKREELTTEGGLNVRAQESELCRIVEILQGKGVTVSLFVDPDDEQIKACVQTGASAVEFHTGGYAEAYLEGGFEGELKKLGTAVEAAKREQLTVHAGHGLTYQNAALIAGINGIEELNIGHTIIARAVFVGLERAVKDMLAIVGV